MTFEEWIKDQPDGYYSNDAIFQAGAASRDAEIARLLEINSNICERSNRNITEIARLEKERDQLREILKDHGEIQAALCKETEELKERLK